MPDIDTLERLLRSTAVYGLGFVFLAAFAGITVYGAFYLVKHGVDILAAIKTWLPRWFGSQVELHQSLQKNLDTQADTMKETQSTLKEMQTTMADTNKGVVELLVLARRRQDE